MKRSDELRALAEAFNDMTDRIRDMLHTKEQLMLDVSHELRSPITRMRVALEFLPEGQTKDSLKSDIAEMEAMINDILETARMHHLHGHLKRQLINLADLLEGILADYVNQRPGVQAGNFPAEIELNVDPEQVKTVFQNILTNAVKFSDPDDKPVMISVIMQANFTDVRILDHGIGIPPDELPFIFEPFYRVDKSRSKRTGGYGLGLSLCKTIMEAHGGRIEVDSEPGVGTCVSLFFPQ
jgi:signal transduction histidine kinase